MYKRGIVSLSIFSLLIFLFIGLLLFNYYFYKDSTKDVEILNIESKLDKSLSKFRKEIIELTLINDSYLTYNDLGSDEEFMFYVSDSVVIGKSILDNNYVESQISLYGINFCDTVSFSPRVDTKFYYNGICVSHINS